MGYRDHRTNTATWFAAINRISLSTNSAVRKGLRALQRTIRRSAETVPVLLDVKRGDIGSTAQAYAKAAFEQWGADAVTLSPYLGEDSVKPFLAYEGKAAFLLCHTSNPSAAQVQHHGEPPLFEYMASAAQAWGSANQIGLVIGATQPEAMAAVRGMCPDNWFLAPGVGAQGGDLAAALRAGLRADGSGMIVPVSRGVIMAADPAPGRACASRPYQSGAGRSAACRAALFQREPDQRSV